MAPRNDKAVQVYVGVVAVFLPAPQFEAHLILENVRLACKAPEDLNRLLFALYVHRCLGFPCHRSIFDLAFSL